MRARRTSGPGPMGHGGLRTPRFGSWCAGGAHDLAQEMQEIQEIQERPCGASNKPFCRVASAAVLEVLFVLFVLPRRFRETTETQGMRIGSEARRAERPHFAFQSVRAGAKRQTFHGYQPGAPTERLRLRGKLSRAGIKRDVAANRHAPQAQHHNCAHCARRRRWSGESDSPTAMARRPYFAKDSGSSSSASMAVLASGSESLNFQGVRFVRVVPGLASA